MSDPEIRILSQVVVSRVLTDDGDMVDHVTAQTSDGDELGLAEALGMMRLAEDTLIRARMAPADGDDDE